MSPMVYGQKVLGELEELGFRNIFDITNGLLRCVETDEYYTPRVVSLWASFRYDGYADPDSSQIIYALEACDGTRGAVSDAYGVYSNPDLSQFLEGVRDRRRDSRISMVIPAYRSIRIQAKSDLN